MSREKMMELVGITEDDLKPSEEQVTITDIVEALDILTNIVLGGDENG